MSKSTETTITEDAPLSRRPNGHPSRIISRNPKAKTRSPEPVKPSGPIGEGVSTDHKTKVQEEIRKKTALRVNFLPRACFENLLQALAGLARASGLLITTRRPRSSRITRSQKVGVTGKVFSDQIQCRATSGAAT